MSPPRSLTIGWSLLSFVGLPTRCVFAADPLYTTVFLVGPEPEPVVADRADSPLGSGVNVTGNAIGMVSKPLASLSATDWNGGRKLSKKKHQESATTADLSLSQHRVRDGTVRDSEGATRRALLGMCNITTTIAGYNFTDNLAETSLAYIPPDPHGAAGMSRLVAVGNLLMEVRQKDGTLQFRHDFPTFFSDFPEASDTGTSFTDPKVIYDEHEGRFVIVILQLGGSPKRSRIWLAVSKGETPDTASDWYKVYINSLTRIGGFKAFADYPGLEVDEEAVYITANMFGTLRSRFKGIRLWVVDKGVSGGFYSGAQPSWTVYNPFASVGVAEVTMPAQIHGSNGVDGSVGTFFPSVSLKSDGSVSLQVYTLFNPLTSPTYIFQTINLGVMSQPNFGSVEAAQLGTTVKIDTGDYRTQDAVWRNNKLWVVFTYFPISGVNQGQATAHWVRLGTSGGVVTFEAQGDLGGEDISTETHTFFPSVAVNSRGVVAYGYAASSPTTYAGAYVSVGTSELSYMVKSGLAPYVRTFGGDRNRWGDYSGISVDPTDDSFWVFNEFADFGGFVLNGEDGLWGTAWARLACVAPPLTAPTPAPIQAPQPNPPTIPAKNSCGFLGLSLFCPITFCGIFGRLLGLCS